MDESTIVGSSTSHSKLYRKIEIAVFKATNKQLCVPKAKHVKALIAASYRREVSIDDIFRYISLRLRESHWIVVWKTLLLVHHLLREGNSFRLYSYLVNHPQLLNLSRFSDRKRNAGIIQTRNIKCYSIFLEEKLRAYKLIQVEFASQLPTEAYSELRSLTIEKGLFKHARTLMQEVCCIVETRFNTDDIDNVLASTSYGLMIRDLLKIYHALNEVIINILESFFQFSMHESKEALLIYKEFVALNEKVTNFCGGVERIQHLIGFSPPRLSQAPTKILASIEEYCSEEQDRNQETSNVLKSNEMRSTVDEMSKHNNLLLDLDFGEHSTMKHVPLHSARKPSPITDPIKEQQDTPLIFFDEEVPLSSSVFPPLSPPSSSSFHSSMPSLSYGDNPSFPTYSSPPHFAASGPSLVSSLEPTSPPPSHFRMDTYSQTPSDTKTPMGKPGKDPFADLMDIFQTSPLSSTQKKT